MGPSGFSNREDGKKIWFVCADDRPVEVKILGRITRIVASDSSDYTILMFDRDLPGSIQPMSVVSEDEVRNQYPYVAGALRPVFQTEQNGHVNAGIPGFSVETWKGGDSGSPDMLPVDNKLVFFRGRSTSGPSPKMQEDMDDLCRRAGLDPRQYQMQWVDLSSYRVK